MAPPDPSPLTSHGRRRRLGLAFVLGVVVVPAGYVSYLALRGELSSAPATDAPRQAAAPAGGQQLRDAYSNIHRADYVGPEVCGECHERQYDSWKEHPHSRMNRTADADIVRGDFSGARARYGTLEATFERDGEDYRMRFAYGPPGARVRRAFRVTRTVGSRFTQMYIGVQTEGPEPAGAPIYQVERKLPYGYWTTRGQWFPVNYFDTDLPPDYGGDDNAAAIEALFRGTHWERNCIYCHNTYAYSQRLRSGFDNLAGFPRADLALPGADPAGVLDTLSERVQRRRPLPVEQLVTLGISCESCHFGGRIHAADDEVRPRFVPTSPELSFPKASAALVDGARESPYVIGSICAQCHSANGVSRYPNGAGTWNSREALDFLGSACAAELSCTGCHDPHVASPPGGGDDDPAHLRACVGCHDNYADDAARAAHTRHGPGVSCLDCHMPRIVQGLDAVVRTHRIYSPDDAAMLDAAAPNACNLCHLDRSLRWTLEALSARGAKRSPALGKPAFEGVELDGPMRQTWAGHRLPIVRLVLSDALSRGEEPATALPLLLSQLDDPVAVNRMFARFAIERVLGRPLPEGSYDATAPPSERQRQIAALRRELAAPVPP